MIILPGSGDEERELHTEIDLDDDDEEEDDDDEAMAESQVQQLLSGGKFSYEFFRIFGSFQS